MKVQHVANAMLQAKRPWQPGLWSGPGFYAIYLRPGACLSGAGLSRERLVYIGNSQSGCTLVQHFAPPNGDSRASDLRQTIGALLMQELGLSARSHGRLSGLFRMNTQLSFTPESEDRLDAWMQANLECAFIPFRGDACAASWILVSSLRPALNLSGWKNPQAGMIRSLRRKMARRAQPVTAPQLEAA